MNKSQDSSENLPADLSVTLPDARARLEAAWRKLTLKQRAGVAAIIVAEITGTPIESLLRGPGAIATHQTYYGPTGWRKDPDFNAALTLAREVNWDLKFSATVRRTHERLVEAGPEAMERLKALMDDPDHALGLRAAESIL